MPTRRSQFIVVSNDPEIIRSCQAAADQTDRLDPLLAVDRPDLLPGALDLNDWIVVDLDFIGLDSSCWKEELAGLAGQIVATGSDEQRLTAESCDVNAGRFVPRSDLDRQLGRLFAGAHRATRLAGAPRPTQPPREDRRHPPRRDLALARQFGEFAARIASLDRKQVVDACLEQCASWFQARLVSLYELDDRRQCLVLRGKTHPYAIDERINLDHGSGQPIVRAARSRQLLLAQTPQETSDLLGQVPRQARDDAYRTDACLIAPITVGTKLIGVLNLADPLDASGFSDQHMALIGATCNLIGAALNNARVFEEVQEQARTDGLTGLVNRQTFMALLSREALRAKRYGEELSLAMIDMDGLKEVNDTYGHLAGDAVIREAAERIRHTIREIDTAARYGGDEFAVILPNTNSAQAEHVADRLAAAMAERPCRWQGKDIFVTFSVGLCQFETQLTSIKMVETADAALYAAKSRRRNCVTVSVD